MKRGFTSLQLTRQSHRREDTRWSNSQYQNPLSWSSYLCGGEASVRVLLGRQPPDDAGGIAQVFGSRRGPEFSQQNVGADLNRQRGRRICCCLRPVEEPSYKQISWTTSRSSIFINSLIGLYFEREKISSIKIIIHISF